MEEKSVVGVIYGDNPCVQYSWIIPFNLYKKYLDPDFPIDPSSTYRIEAGHNQRFLNTVGIVIKSFLEEEPYSLVLFGDVKIIIPNERLYLQENLKKNRSVDYNI